MNYPAISNIMGKYHNGSSLVTQLLVQDAIAKGVESCIHVRTPVSHPSLLFGKQVASLVDGCDWVFVPSEQHWTTQCDQGQPLLVVGGNVTAKLQPLPDPECGQHRHSPSLLKGQGVYEEHNCPESCSSSLSTSQTSSFLFLLTLTSGAMQSPQHPTYSGMTLVQPYPP